MEVAIQYDKYNLGFDRYFFKPVGIIKGKYDDLYDTFETEYDYVYERIDGFNFDSDYYFYGAVTLDELKQRYGNHLTEDDLIKYYLGDNIDICYIGSFDSLSDKMNLVTIDLNKLDIDSNYNLDYSSKSDELDSPELTVDLDRLEKVINSNDINEMKNELTLFLTAFLKETEMSNTYSENDSEKALYKKTDKKQNIEKKTNYKKQISLDELQKEVMSKVIGQDKAVKTVTTRILKNYIATDKENKTHILIAGSTGTGKTEMIELTCNYLGLPCKSVDATSFTQEGYVGSSVDDIICGLINVCNGDIKMAENGIIIIDEIDKKCSPSSKETVSSKAVLDSLLKILGRKKFQLEYGRGNLIDFDTSNLTVILTGAFEGIKKDSDKKTKNIIGFGERTEKEEKVNSVIEPEDFVKYGMTPEIMGRIDCIAFTNDLTVEDFIQIIYKSKISALIKEKKLYENDLGIKFNYTYPYVKEIAKKAKLYKTGARGIKRAVEESLEDVDQKVLSSKKKIKSIKLTKETTKNNKKYYIEYV